MPGVDLKRVIRFIVVSFFITIAMCPMRLSAEDSITWVKQDFPPAWILQGSDKGNGMIDGFISIYEKYLPEYEHHYVTANRTRTFSMMKEGENVCDAGLLKTPDRENFIYFSIPNGITDVHKIVAKQSRIKSLFGNNSRVSLGAMVKDRNLKLGVAKDSSYGATIDKILEENKENGTILFRSGQDVYLGLLRMLMEERIDYSIGYPWVIKYLASQNDLLGDFAVIEIEELGELQWIVSYVGCTKNEWGRHVTQKLNAILRKVRPGDEYLSHILRWQPQSARPRVKEAYKEQVLKVTE